MGERGINKGVPEAASYGGTTVKRRKEGSERGTCKKRERGVEGVREHPVP